MRLYIVRYLLGIGVAAVVVVALWWGWVVYDGVDQADDAASDAILTVGQCIEVNATVGPLEEALIKEDIIEEDLLQTKVTNGMCKDMLERVTDGTPVQKLVAAQNYIQEITLIKGAMREAADEAADEAAGEADARGTDWYSSSDESLILFRAIAQISEQVPAQAQYNGPGGIEPTKLQAATITDCSELSGAEHSYDEVLAQCEAAAEKDGASSREAAAGTRCGLEVDVLDDEVKRIKGLYEITPQIPKEIRLRVPEQAGLLVSPVTKKRFQEIKQKHGVIAEASESDIGCVDLADRMKAKLVPLDLESKPVIDRHHPDDILELSANRETRWGWEITARHTGKLELSLDLSYAISREGQEFRKIAESPVYEEAIRVTPRQSDSNQDAGERPWWRRIFGAFGV